jgi:hypothetical protein
MSVAVLMVVMSAPAIADTLRDADAVPVAPPASSQCVGPGCTDDQGQLQPLVALVGAGPGCADGGACFWVQTDFDGDKGRIDDVGCCQWVTPGDIDRFRSAKNRYLTRKVLTGNEANRTSCMDPGESRPDLEVSDRVRVGSIGSSC